MISTNQLTDFTMFIMHHPARRHLLKRSLCATFILTILAIAHIASAQSAHDQPSEQQSYSKSHNGLCPKSWIHMGRKCYKLAHSPRNYEMAKSKCSDFSAQLATVEDESAKEKETSDGASVNLLTHLANTQRRPEQQNKQYYVNLSPDLYNQYHQWLQGGYSEGSGADAYEHGDSGVSLSELWLTRDDPSLANITVNTSENPQLNVSFVLAFSNLHKRWGLVPVSSTRKMSSICERPVSQSAVQPASSSNTPATSRHQSIEAKRAGDLSGQESSSSATHSVGSQSSPNSSDQHKSTEKETSTTPQPDSSASVLFREFPTDQSIVLGSTAEMRCSPLENESSLQWTFNGKNLSQSNRIRVHKNGILKIEHVRNSDDGTYTCTIISGGVSESKTARLEIIERPHQPEYISAELLDRLSTSVRVTWSPGFTGNSPILKYMVEMRTVNSETVDSDKSSIMISKEWEMAKANISADQTSAIIPDLKPARKYIFRVRATNRVGTGEPSLPTKPPIEVPVQPPSSAPENVTGSPKSSTSIAIQWSPPPAETQNGVITGYKIRHKLAGYASDSSWYTNSVNEAAHLSYVLEDLIVWQNYEIQVAAENDKGVGPFSASIEIRTKEGKPDKGPRAVSAEAVSSTSIKINWKPPPPQHINGLNQGYRVQIWQDSEYSQLVKELQVSHSTISPIHLTTVDGLMPYTDYYVTVKCLTNAGDGPTNEDPVTVKTKPDRPEAVQSIEFADVLDKTLRVMWKPPKRTNGELDHYTLEYSETSMSDKKILKNYPASTTEARILDLMPQTSYTFKIYPHTIAGQGPGKVVQITTSVPPVLPEPPAQLEVSNISAHSVVLSFSPGFSGNAHIDRWNVEALSPTRVGEYAPQWQMIYVSNDHTDDKSIVVRNLKPFTRYKLRLTPFNIVGASKYPSESTREFQTAQVEPEQPPRDLRIEEIKSNSVVARWSPLSNSLWLGSPHGYNITWSEANNSTIMHYLINDTRADSIFITDLEEYTEYVFRIYALNGAGSSPPSESVSAMTLEDVPSMGPSNVTAHATASTAINVEWNSVPKRHRNGIIRGYKIQYQIARPNAPLQFRTIDDNATRRVTINDLKAFTTYQLSVSAFTSVGGGVSSNVVSVQTLEDTPGTPQNLSTPQVSQTTARILWDPPENPNGDIIGYKVTYHTVSDGSKEVASHELQQSDRTFKATNLKPFLHYIFTVTAKTKEGWGQQASMLVYTSDSELRANLPFYRESWFVILCACSSIVITIIITALLFVQTKSHKYRQDVIKSNSQDKLGDAGFVIDDEANGHYNNGFGLLSQSAYHKRSTGALSQSTANFTLPKSPPRPHPGSVVYSDEGDDDVFEDIVDKPVKPSRAGTSNYDSSGDSVTEKPSEISSSPAPDSESVDDEYVNMATRNFVNHYANVNGTLKSQRSWKKGAKQYTSHRTKPKLPQRPAPSVPQVPGGEPSSSSSDTTAANQPVPGTSGMQTYGETAPKVPQANSRTMSTSSSIYKASSEINGSSPTDNQSQNTQLQQQSQQQQADALSHVMNLNGGRIIVNNMAGSRAPLPGFSSFLL